MKPFVQSLPLTLILTGLLVSAPALGADYTVAQSGKAFSIDALEIHVGDTVHFANEDVFFHNVFSLSDTKTFDLGSYPKGSSKEVQFDSPGSVEVECAIHPQMFMVVTVKE